jgi:protein-S-isoprenylcysteine O-methyltransferase Ste14
MTDIREKMSRDDAGVLLRDYHDARRREDQWRIPQLLLALVAPVMALIAVVLDMMGTSDPTAAGALAVITGVAAALLAVQVWRWHGIAVSRVNRFRMEYPAESALLLKDPI